MGNHIFLKKNGTIKKHYIDACKLILSASYEQITVIGYKEQIEDSYQCYRIKNPDSSIRDAHMQDFRKEHIVSIVKEYGLIPRIWYGLYWEAIDFKDQNDLFIQMINDIQEYVM